MRHGYQSSESSAVSLLGVLDTIPEPFHLVLVGTRDAKPDLISWD